MLPKRPLNNIDLNAFGQHLPHFRGVFMRDNLPTKSKRNECAILNLQTTNESGSHWVAYIKHQNKKFIRKYGGANIIYFDGFGNLGPPQELIAYLGDNIKYNHDSFQNYNTVICGHLCLLFLYKYCNEIFIK